MANVRLFANLREMAGTGRVEVDAATVDETLDVLASRFGDEFSVAMEHAKVWVNGDEAAGDTVVASADEIALIPPVSGGAQTYQAAEGFEPLIVAVAVIALLAANLLLDTVALVVALIVGLVGLWAVDISGHSLTRGLVVDAWPILAAALIGALAVTGIGPAGMGLGVAFGVVASLGWAVMRPEARQFVGIAALALASAIAAAATASLTLARLSTAGDDKIAAFVVMTAASIVVTWLVGSMRRPFLDPFTAGAIAAVIAAVGVAALTSLDLIAWFLTGIVTAVSLISGRGIGAAYRTGEVYLSERVAGTFAVLDGPVVAAAIFFPFLRFVG